VRYGLSSYQYEESPRCPPLETKLRAIMLTGA